MPAWKKIILGLIVAYGGACVIGAYVLAFLPGKNREMTMFILQETPFLYVLLAMAIALLAIFYYFWKQEKRYSLS